jgi:hypothetical protein
MNNRVVKLAPSVLFADFSRLGEQGHEAEEAGADHIHSLTSLPSSSAAIQAN